MKAPSVWGPGFFGTRNETSKSTRVPGFPSNPSEGQRRDRLRGAFFRSASRATLPAHSRGSAS